MIPRPTTPSILLTVSMGLCGCAREPAHGPPTIHLGDDICSECGMIISDERFTCASVTRDDPAHSGVRLFDDFNCMMNHEAANPAMAIADRWVHDYATRVWIDAEVAIYLCSRNLQTPMASHVAAFGDRGGAESMRGDLGGDVLSFAEIRDAFARNGACAQISAPPGQAP